MKKLFFILFLGLGLAACSTDDPFSDVDDPTGSGESSSGGTSSTSGSTATSTATDTSDATLTTFDIDLDTSALTEEYTVPTDESASDYEDYLENNTFSKTVTVTYSNSGVELSGDTEDVTAANDGTNVVLTSTAKKMIYVLTGTCDDGSFKLYSDNKFELVFNNLNLKSSSRAAVNIQSKKRAYVVLKDGTENTISDASSYSATTDNEDMKACLFSEGKLLFSGKGTLNVAGNCKNAICSDDYVRVLPGVKLNITANASNGIKTNDAIWINGGVLNITVSAAASKGLKSDGNIDIMGGRTTILTTGAGEYDSDDKDVNGSAGIKTDSTFTMKAGILRIKSTGNGGKGINTDQALTIDGGTIDVITTGKEYTYSNLSASPKGIRSEANITINGGTIRLRTTGGEGSEALESKNTLTINDGLIQIYSYDDAINASKNVTINGGKIYAYATNNDGIDSNGTLTITGGVVVASGTATPEEGLDSDQNTFTITGGTIIGIGGSTSTPTSSTTKQGVIVFTGSANSGVVYHLSDSKGNHILSYQVPRNYSQMSLLMSASALSSGNSYTLSTGGAISGGTCFYGLTTGSTLSGTTTVSTISMNSTVTTSGSSSGSMGGGGNNPGGGGGMR